MGMTLRLPAGTATGIGSMPQEDPMEAARVVFGELPDLPHLPELPQRGAGADLLGRTAALLVDLAVDIQPSGWRLVPSPGVDLRRARDFLARDLDAFEQVAAGYAGVLKVQCGGPWTLAAGVELHRGDKAIADAGAVRDLRESLAEGLRLHLADLHKRCPDAELVLQLDEPTLPIVLSGRVPTASGFGMLRAVEEHVAVSALRKVVELVQGPVLAHCCARDAPVDLFRRAGVAGISIDLAMHDQRDDEAIGVAVEAGLVLALGVLPGVDGRLPAGGDVAAPARQLWHRLGFAAERLGEQAVLTPACGLAGVSPDHARLALTRCREGARSLVDAPE